jgi:hypothetical protein
MEKLDLLVVVIVVESKRVRNAVCFHITFGRNSFVYGMNDPGPIVEGNAFHDSDFHRGASASSVPQTLVLHSHL